MSPTLEKIKDVASELPASERLELAAFLLTSVDEADETAVRTEWLAVAEERLAEIKAGKVTGIPADEVLRRLLEPKR